MKDQTLQNLFQLEKSRMRAFFWGLFFFSFLILIFVDYYAFLWDVKKIVSKNVTTSAKAIELFMEKGEVEAKIYIENIQKIDPGYIQILAWDFSENRLLEEDIYLGDKKKSFSLVSPENLRQVFTKKELFFERRARILTYVFPTEFGALLIQYNANYLFYSFLYFSLTTLAIFGGIVLFAFFTFRKKANKTFGRVLEVKEEEFTQYALSKEFGVAFFYPSFQSLEETFPIFLDHMIQEKKWYFRFLKRFSIPFILLNKDRKQVFMNVAAEQLFGKTLEQMQIGVWIDEVDGKDRDRVLEMEKRVFVYKQSQKLVFSIHRVDGTKTDVLGTFQPVFDDLDEMQGCLHIFNPKLRGQSD